MTAMTWFANVGLRMASFGMMGLEVGGADGGVCLETCVLRFSCWYFDWKSLVLSDLSDHFCRGCLS